MKTTYKITLLLIIKLLFLITMFSYNYIQSKEHKITQIKSDNFEINFGDNTLGYGQLIIPNIVHFIRFGNQSKYFDFVSYITIKSVLINQSPDKIYIHCDCSQLSGKYWHLLRDENRIIVRQIEMPTHVFGRKLDADWQVWHASDIKRLEILMKFGGIYLDNDVYVLKKLDRFRIYEMCIGWDEKSGQPLGNQILMAHRNARFLRIWYNLYRMYDPNKWYFNAGELPSKVLNRYPELIHKVNKSFGITFDLFPLLYEKFDAKLWNEYDLHCIHLLVNHRYYLDKNYNKMPVFNENNIKNNPTKFGELARLMRYGNVNYVN